MGEVSEKRSGPPAKASLPIKPSSKVKKSMIMKQEDSTLKLISNAIKSSTEQAKSGKTSDEFDVYGSFIASELRSINDPYTRDKIKNEIGQVFFNAKWSQSRVGNISSNVMQSQLGYDVSTNTSALTGMMKECS
jgi:hypothetical protein